MLFHLQADLDIVQCSPLPASDCMFPFMQPKLISLFATICDQNRRQV